MIKRIAPMARLHSLGKQQIFGKIAQAANDAVGTPKAFIGAVLVVLVWLVTGPLFSFSNTWQLVINTGTTIVTFLLVFLIQYVQNQQAVVVTKALESIQRIEEQNAATEERLMGELTAARNELAESRVELAELRQMVAVLCEHFALELTHAS